MSSEIGSLEAPDRIEMSSAAIQDLQQLFVKLRHRSARMAVAESCTGGLLSSWITRFPGISDLYLGGIVSYSNDAKKDILGVRQNTLDSDGAVSETTALQMAKGVQTAFKSDYQVAITGIAGPGGGTSIKPVGTVCFGVCGPAIEKTTTQLFAGNRVEIQRQAAHFAVQFLLSSMNV